MLLQCAWVQGFESSTFAKHVWIGCVRRVLGVKWFIFNFICIFLKLHAHSFELQIQTDILNCLPNAILSWDKNSFSATSVLRTVFYNRHAIGSNPQDLIIWLNFMLLSSGPNKIMGCNPHMSIFTTLLMQVFK